MLNAASHALSLLLATYSFASSSSFLCPSIVVHDGSIRLNANEKVLICGDEKSSEGWKKIPNAQARLLLTGVMHNLGYMNPRFESESDILHIWPGEPSKITSLQVRGGREFLNPEKKRKIVGEILTQERLDQVNSWVDWNLKRHGFACPKLTLEAHSWDGAVLVTNSENIQQYIVSFDHDQLDGLNPTVLKRYQPFELGDLYDIRETQLMSQRMLADGLFQNAYFSTQCELDQVKLNLNTATEKPKLLQFGIGASTEEFPFIELSLKNTRLDAAASSLNSVLHLSPRVLSLNVSSALYWFPIFPMIFFAPRFDVSREIESSYTLDTSRIGADIGRNWDTWNTRMVALVGPTLNYSNTLEGIGPTETKYLTFDASLTALSHAYEYLLSTQSEGWTGSILYQGRLRGLGSNFNGHRYEINYKYLWNIGGYSPPLIILGTRIQAVAVTSDSIDLSQNLAQIPIEDRLFLGGDQDLRGFSRKSINNNNLGYLTSSYIGFDLRLIEQLPYHLQPLLLVDIARLGAQSWTLQAPVFTSEGFGLRWSSPFGTVRGYIAHGHIFSGDESTENYPQQWVYFLSFGQEF